MTIEATTNKAAENGCFCHEFPDDVLCTRCKLAAPCDGCDGCGGQVKFERLATGELLCAICTAVDASDLMPEPPFEERIGLAISGVLAGLLRLLGLRR